MEENKEKKTDFNILVLESSREHNWIKELNGKTINNRSRYI